jgi:hypothetical protein
MDIKNLFLHSPIFRIFTVLIALWVLIGLVLWALGGHPFSFILNPLAIIIGPGMLIFASDGYQTQLTLACVFVVMVLGLKYRKHNWGQSLVIFGVIAWTFIGILGLSTGT